METEKMIKLFSLSLLLVLSSISYGKEYLISITEREDSKTVQCMFKEVNGNRVLICSDKNFQISEPITTSIVDTDIKTNNSTVIPSGTNNSVDIFKNMFNRE